jgi:hypothetical protein
VIQSRRRTRHRRQDGGEENGSGLFLASQNFFAKLLAHRSG